MTRNKHLFNEFVFILKKNRNIVVFFTVILGVFVMFSTLQTEQLPNHETKKIDGLYVETRVKQLVSDEVTKYVNELNDIRDQKLFPPTKELLVSKKLRIVVTGGAGFVGSHLVDKLMRQGHEVTVLDNFFTGRRENIAQWIGHKNFRLVTHDVVNPYMVEADQIYHLACPASPPHYQ